MWLLVEHPKSKMVLGFVVSLQNTKRGVPSHPYCGWLRNPFRTTQEPWIDDSPGKYQQTSWFAMVSTWCERISSTAISAIPGSSSCGRFRFTGECGCCPLRSLSSSTELRVEAEGSLQTIPEVKHFGEAAKNKLGEPKPFGFGEGAFQPEVSAKVFLLLE